MNDDPILKNSAYDTRCDGEADVRRIVRALCKGLHIRRPRLKFTRATNAGRYISRTRTIKFHRNGLHWVLVHEVAHHLHRTEMMKRAKESGFSSPFNGDDRSHGPNFMSALICVARVAYGDECYYPWTHDYASLRKAWLKRVDQQKAAGLL